MAIYRSNANDAKRAFLFPAIAVFPEPDDNLLSWGHMTGCLLSHLPVGAQFFIEFLPAFLREEDSGALQFDAAPCAGNVVGQPVRPFHVEVHIVGAPDDESRRF